MGYEFLTVCTPVSSKDVIVDRQGQHWSGRTYLNDAI